MYKMEINLKGLPKTTNGSHGHWAIAAKNRRTWKIAVAHACKQAGVPPLPLERAKVTCIRFSVREPDFDNLVISFKPLIDGLKLAEVIKDDRGSVIGQPTYRWEKSKAREGRVTIKVEAA